MVKVLRITAKEPKGLWRAGVHHPSKEVEHRADKFDEQQTKALKGEALLVVVEAEVEDAEDDAEAETGGSPAKAKAKSK